MLNLNKSCACGWTLDKEISGWFTLLGNHQGLLFAVSSTGRCNAILNQGGRCHETKNSD